MQYTYDRQNKSVLFCCQNNFYVEQTGVLRPRLFRGRDAPFGTIKAQTLSNQVELVLVFIIMRWSRSDGAPFGILHPNRKVSAVHLVIMIRLSRLEMQRIFRVTNQNES